MTKFQELVGKEIDTGTMSWDAGRAMLYAVGVGAGSEDPTQELQFTTENSEGIDQQVIPSFLALMSPGGGWIKQLGFKSRQWDGLEWGYPEGLVHGSQSVSLARPIPPSGTVNMSQVLLGVYDKGSGALAVSETRVTLADTGETLGTARAGMFIRGQGGFGGPRTADDEVEWVRPDRKPDEVVSLTIPVNQSLIYRHMGDVNPHATDPLRAKEDGFPKPIFFGLGTYGFACRALLMGLCDGDVARFGAMDGRFSQPVFPGERLDTMIWHTDGGALFETAASGERLVIDRGVFRYAG
ncbi:MAG: MaoC family dehydratase N-terminal domain-containing protein [Novosphingobium sp.]|nr:MaoC family dehydratase N-terminal domain-containing protein [Novosphingobium sp.]